MMSVKKMSIWASFKSYNILIYQGNKKGIKTIKHIEK